MERSNIEVGQMFIQFPQPILELQDTPKPRVWVKVCNDYANGEEISLFVDNDALVGISIGAVKTLGIRDKWLITDKYYGENVRKGSFVAIDDLRQVEDICLELGCELPESRWF